MLYTKVFLLACVVSLTGFAQTTFSPTQSPTVTPFYCTSNADCSNHGTCDVTEGKCYCESGYTEENCDYEQKSQLTAFLLNFFLGLPTGAGALYIDEYLLGFGQVMGFWSGLLFTKLYFLSTDCSEKFPFVVLSGLTMGTSVVSWAVLVALFGFNKVKDSNGKPLESW